MLALAQVVTPLSSKSHRPSGLARRSRRPGPDRSPWHSGSWPPGYPAPAVVKARFACDR